MNKLNLTGWIEQRRVDAVEVHQLPDGTQLMHHIALLRNGKRLQVLDMNTSLTTIQSVADLISKGVLVVLVLTGKGVLMRSSSLHPDTSVVELINSVFPNAQADDFLISQEPKAGNGMVLCLTRNILAENIVQEFLSRKVKIAEVLIGPLAIAHILPLLDPLSSNVLTGQYCFSHTKGKLVDAHPMETESPVEVKVGELTLPGVMLCSFAAAFDFLIINYCNPTTSLALVRENAMGLRIVARVKGAIAISLGILIIILIGNFFLYNHYINKYNQLTYVVEENLSVAERTDSLKDLIKQREQFLKQLQGNGCRKCSFIIDRISASMPAGITLTDITVHPILFKKDELGKMPDYQSQTIHIHALVKESSALNHWIKRLEKMQWIESVAFSDYLEKEGHEAGVTLEIIMK